MTTNRKKIPLRRRAASIYLKEIHGISRTEKTLAKLACTGGGPVMVYDGRFPLYPPDELDKYAVSQLSRPVRSTSELAAIKAAEAENAKAEDEAAAKAPTQSPRPAAPGAAVDSSPCPAGAA